MTCLGRGRETDRFVAHDAGTFMFSCFCVSKYLVKLVMVMPRISLVFGSLLTMT